MFIRVPYDHWQVVRGALRAPFPQYSTVADNPTLLPRVVDVSATHGPEHTAEVLPPYCAVLHIENSAHPFEEPDVDGRNVILWAGQPLVVRLTNDDLAHWREFIDRWYSVHKGMTPSAG